MPAPQCSTQSALNGFTHQQVHAGDAQEQHGAFESNGTVMQLVEFHSPRIRFRRVLHRHHFFPERFHSVAYAELRRGGEQHHQHDAESRSIRKAPEIVRAGQPGNQKDNSQKNSRKVQPRQRKTHHHSRGIAIPKNRKRAGSYHKTEKSNRPQPQAQTQKLNRSKESCHEGFPLHRSGTKIDRPSRIYGKVALAPGSRNVSSPRNAPDPRHGVEVAIPAYQGKSVLPRQRGNPYIIYRDGSSRPLEFDTNIRVVMSSGFLDAEDTTVSYELIQPFLIPIPVTR